MFLLINHLEGGRLSNYSTLCITLITEQCLAYGTHYNIPHVYASKRIKAEVKALDVPWEKRKAIDR